MDNLTRDTLKMLRKQRSFWVKLDGREWSVQFRRPQESKMPQMLNGVTVDHVIELAVDWKDVTPADLIGAAGGSDPLEFDRELWDDWVRDNIDVIKQCATAIAEKISEHIKRRAEAGNA